MLSITSKTLVNVTSSERTVSFLLHHMFYAGYFSYFFKLYLLLRFRDRMLLVFLAVETLHVDQVQHPIPENRQDL